MTTTILDSLWTKIYTYFPTKTQVSNALANKQDAINNLQSIVSGAAAGATAYQKPANGIPSTDLASGVLPTTMGASGSEHASGLVPDTSSTAGTTKYLREDATWVTPPNDNTTYTFAEGSTNGAFTVTPSGGSATPVTVHGVFKGTISTTTINGSLTNVAPASGLNAGEEMHIIYVNGGSADYTIAITTDYKTPDGQALELTCPNGGYCEANFFSDGTNIYVRGV